MTGVPCQPYPVRPAGQSQQLADGCIHSTTSRVFSAFHHCPRKNRSKVRLVALSIYGAGSLCCGVGLALLWLRSAHVVTITRLRMALRIPSDITATSTKPTFHLHPLTAALTDRSSNTPRALRWGSQALVGDFMRLS